MSGTKNLSKLARCSLSVPKTTLSKTASWQSLRNPLQSRNLASVIPPVMQDSTGSKGPTAMVFMNMGGPSTTDEVGGFLSRLFVRHLIPPSPFPSLPLALSDLPLHPQQTNLLSPRPTATSSRSAVCNPTSDPSSPDAARPKSKNNTPPSGAARPSGAGPNTKSRRCASCSTAPRPPPRPTNPTSRSGTRTR